MQRVAVVGGGYAGVRVARDLAQLGKFEIILVSDQAHHLDTTQLYEIATAYLPHESQQSSERVAAGSFVSLAEIFAGLPVTLVKAEVTRIDRATRLLHCADHTTISYDHLVLAVGSAVATYHIPGVIEHAFILKTLSDALRLRHHMVRQFHAAARHLTPGQAKTALTFVVAGGGAAGVETASEWAHHVRKQCRKMNLDPRRARVLLVEAGSEILREAPPAVRTRALRRLSKQGIEVRCGKAITRVEPAGVWLGETEEAIPTATVIWTAGLAAHPLLTASGLPMTVFGLSCAPTLQVKGEPHIWAAGDCARIERQATIPATVPVAHTQAALVARNIEHQRRGQPLEEYSYRQLGALVTLGGKQAVAFWPDSHSATGFSVWLTKKLLTLRYWDRLLSPLAALRLWLSSLKVQSLND